MAISIKKSSQAETQTSAASTLTDEVKTQITNNIKLDTTDYTKEETPKTRRTDDMLQIKLSKGKRAEAKSFFAGVDLKLNNGFEMAYEYLKQEYQAGRIKISKSGIVKVQ